MKSKEESPEVVNEEVQEPVEEKATDEKWDYPFSKTDLEGWKAQYKHVWLLEDVLKEPVVIRGMGRSEYNGLNLDVKTREEEDEEMTYKVLLYPSMTITEIRNQKAAFPSTVHGKFKELCHGITEDNEMYEPVELPSTIDELPEEVVKAFNDEIESGSFTMKDLDEWGKKNQTLFVDFIDEQLFLYHGVRRKDFNMWRQGQREGKFNMLSSEEELCRQGVLFPLKKDFKPDSDEFLWGTISLLSIMVMKASGFNKAPTVTKL